MQIGVPQWMQINGLTMSGNAGSAAEVDFNQANTLANTAPLNASPTSRTISGGPTTTSPVLAAYNGVWYALPYNVAASAPVAVWNVISSAAQFTVT